MERRLSVASLYVLTLLVLVGAFAVGPSLAAEPVKMRVGWVNTPTEIHYMLFQKTDVMKHYGKSYVTDFTKFKGSPLEISALASKDIDIGALAFSTIGLAVANAKLPVKVVSSLGRIGAGGKSPLAWMVRPDSGITSIAQLKGKILGTNAIGAGVDILMRVELAKAGLLAGRDYTITEASLPNQGTFLEEKKLDLAVFTNPWQHIATTKKIGRILFTGSQPLGELEFLILVARNEFTEKNREVMVDFYEDYMLALAWFLDAKNRPAVLDLVAKTLKQPASVFAPWFLTDVDYQRSPLPLVQVESLQRGLDAMVEHGFMKDRLDIAKYIDMTYVKAAAKRLGKLKE